jgi:hypothetical protein
LYTCIEGLRMHSPPVVYLDTQDFSKFGDVLRGKSDGATEAIFLTLEQRKQAGDVIFAVSMPLLGELLQFDADFRETTIRKAEAVEQLCGGWALAYPSRLLAFEIAELAKQRGHLANFQSTSLLSPDRYWYPNVADELGNLRERMLATFDEEVAKLNLTSRTQRRLAKKARKFDPVQVARDAAPEMAAKFGLPVEVINGSFVAFLRGSITPEQASRRLFGAIAEPVKFVEAYFEKVETDRTLLPSWMSKIGSDFARLFVEFRDMAQPHMVDASTRNQVRAMVSDRAKSAGRSILGMVDDETEEFGIDAELLARFLSDESFFDELPACKNYGRMVTAYVLQVTGLSGSRGSVERSFGGDMVHSLYLPHVDLWRGDRRFSVLLKSAVPELAGRVVPTIKELPSAIDAWWAARTL